MNTKGIAQDGDRIIVEIPTSSKDGKVIEYEGIVIQQSRVFSGFGIRFESMNEIQDSMIKELIAQAPLQPDERNKT